MSVIIPSYNHARFVGDAIESVLGQDYHDVEVVVVDDGSQDETASVVAGFGQRVHYHYQANQGLSAARNTGIRASSGALIGLLDADDLYEPHFVSQMVSLLDANPGAGGAYCGYRFVDESNRPLPQHEARVEPFGGLHVALLDGNFLVPEALLIRRDSYACAGPFDPSLRALEDWDMWLRISSRVPLVGTGELLTRHRVLSGSMSTDPTRMYLNRLAVLEKHLGVVPDGPEAAEGRVTRAFGRAYLISTVEYLQSGDTRRAVECLQKMALVCPALLVELDTFYLLGCGSQPKGWMGDLDSLDLDRNAAVLLAMLDAVFQAPDCEPRVRHHRRRAHAFACLALGVLNYGARRFDESRRYLARGAMADPRLALTPRVITTMVKSLPVINQVIHRRRGAAAA